MERMVELTGQLDADYAELAVIRANRTELRPSSEQVAHGEEQAHEPQERSRIRWRSTTLSRITSNP